jgi:DNA-binding response OmpR family regulator
MSELSGVTVLVVEDDYYLADDTSLALEGAGANVLGPYVSFDEAQRAIGETKPDCAILDINLGNGPDFTSAAAMRSQGVPIMFVTGYDHATIPSEMKDVTCLQKPTTGRKIVQAVRRICGR